MICENCNKNVATVHLTEIVDDIKKEVHLCEECAAEKGLSFKKQFSLQELLGSLVSQGAKKSGGAESALACPVCGLTFAEFQTRGRFGCAEDYEAFKDVLVPLFEKIHGNTQHYGKVPSHSGKSVANEKEIMEMKQRLAEAIKREQYEAAAELRDRIAKLERETENASKEDAGSDEDN